MNALDATIELLATLTDAAADAWAAADVAGRIEEWRAVVTRPDLIDGPPPLPDTAQTPEERAVVILALAHARGQVTNGELQQALPYWHPETLRLDCARLVALGLLQRSGQRKTTRYTPGARV